MELYPYRMGTFVLGKSVGIYLNMLACTLLPIQHEDWWFFGRLENVVQKRKLQCKSVVRL